MTARQIIEMKLAYFGITNSSWRDGSDGPQLLNKRLNTGKFTVEEWERVGEALGCKVNIKFTLPDGTEI